MEDFAGCLAIIKSGGAVNAEYAERELPLAGVIAVVRKDGQIVAVGAIKANSARVCHQSC
jgi:hypothetical protein